jgi:hypothetical protein
MFRCFFCDEVVPSKQPCNRVVTAWRAKQYPERRADPKRRIVIHRPMKYIDEKGKTKLRYPSDPGGFGREAIQEVSACKGCAQRHGSA